MAQGRTFYVDPNAGTAGDGSSGKPFRTLAAAAARLRPGDVCELRGGVYRETVAPPISGTAAAPIVFRGQGGAATVISGCDPISTPWRHEQGDVYSTELELALDDENQVFADGRMMREARWPNVAGADSRLLLEFPTATMADGTTSTRIVDPALPDIDWTGASTWVASHKRWYCWTGRVTGFGKGFVEIVDNSDASGNHLCQPGGNYFLFGCRAALDAENEWFYDTGEKRLYVWLPGGGRPDDGRVEVKRRRMAFDLRGKAHIELRDLTLLAATVVTDEQSANLVFGRLGIFHPHHASIAEEQYGSQRNSGFALRGGGHTVRDSEIAYSSGNGLLLAGEKCRVVNNYIHDCNYIGGYAAPLAFMRNRSRGHLISHNTIVRAGRSCVETSGFYDCLFQHNDVGFAGYLTDDLGLTYGNGVEAGGSEMRFNHFHDNICHEVAFGIYFDHGCKNLLVHHNLVWNVRDASLVNNQYANYLLYYHNTLAGAKFSYRSDWAAAQKQDLYGCRLVNNLGTAGIAVKGEGLRADHNLWNASTLRKDLLPEGDSPAVDGGQRLDGINDRFAGAAPDCGAFEVGLPRWRAGHTFASPPTDVDERRMLAPHRNLLVNPAWYDGSLDGWTITGKAIELIYAHAGQWTTDGRVVMTGHSVALGPECNRISQTVDGLTPETTYEWMGMFRVDAGGRAILGIDGAYGSPRISDPVVAGDPKSPWQRRTLRFTTAPKQTGVVVFAASCPESAGTVYFDDPGLQWVDANDDCRPSNRSAVRK